MPAGQEINELNAQESTKALNQFLAELIDVDDKSKKDLDQFLDESVDVDDKSKKDLDQFLDESVDVDDKSKADLDQLLAELIDSDDKSRRKLKFQKLIDSIDLIYNKFGGFTKLLSNQITTQSDKQKEEELATTTARDEKEAVIEAIMNVMNYFSRLTDVINNDFPEKQDELSVRKPKTLFGTTDNEKNRYNMDDENVINRFFAAILYMKASVREKAELYEASLGKISDPEDIKVIRYTVEKMYEKSIEQEKSKEEGIKALEQQKNDMLGIVDKRLETIQATSTPPQTAVGGASASSHMGPDQRCK